MKVFHPDIEGLSQEVSKENLDDWLEQGWLKNEPKAAKPAETPPA